MFTKLRKKQTGAFLVISLILLVVLSGLAAAIFSIAITSTKVSKNYAEYLSAQNRALSVAEYGKSLLEKFPQGGYTHPPECDSTASCYQGDLAYVGYPRLVWVPGALGAQSLVDSSQTVNWWSTHGMEYDGTFADGANHYFVIEKLTGDCRHGATYGTNTYRIVGHSSDPTGTTQATQELHYTWNANTGVFHNSPTDTNLSSYLLAAKIAYDNPATRSGTQNVAIPGLPPISVDMGSQHWPKIFVDLNCSGICDHYCRGVGSPTGYICLNDTDQYVLYPEGRTFTACNNGYIGPVDAAAADPTIGTTEFDLEFNDGCQSSDTACILARCPTSCASTCHPSGYCQFDTNESGTCNEGYRMTGIAQNLPTAQCPSICYEQCPYPCPPCTPTTAPCNPHPCNPHPCPPSWSCNCHDCNCGPAGAICDTCCDTCYSTCYDTCYDECPAGESCSTCQQNCNPYPCPPITPCNYVFHYTCF